MSCGCWISQTPKIFIMHDNRIWYSGEWITLRRRTCFTYIYIRKWRRNKQMTTACTRTPSGRRLYRYCAQTTITCAQRDGAKKSKTKESGQLKDGRRQRRMAKLYSLSAVQSWPWPPNPTGFCFWRQFFPQNPKKMPTFPVHVPLFAVLVVAVRGKDRCACTKSKYSRTRICYASRIVPHLHLARISHLASHLACPHTAFPMTITQILLR